MKTYFFLFLFILFLISFTVCCLGTNVKNESLIPPSINNDSKDNYSSFRISEVNFSSIQNLGSGSIHTNASFVAQIALQDKNVQEMLRHGSTIHGIIDFMPSRPKGVNLNRDFE